MSALGEKVLLLSLKYDEGIEHLSKHGLNVKVVPTVDFREVVAWAMTYYQQGGVAPTPEVLKERFGSDLFSDQGVDIDEDAEETIQWAVADLEGTYVQHQIGGFTRRLATEVNSVPPEDRVRLLGQFSSELSGYVQELQPRTTHSDIRESGPALLAEYEISKDSSTRGMTLGIPDVDNHLHGIWPGELVTVSGPPGTGKSFFANYVAHHEWQRGRATTLFTLENSILMTQMRIACCALNVDIEALQTGTLEPQQYQRLEEWCRDVLDKSDTPLHIISPEQINRSPQALIGAARAYETESLIVDQLTHIASVDPMSRDQRNQEIGKIVRALGEGISTGRDPLPCLLLHQVNREGVKHAAATGRVLMGHMAEGSEVERTSSVVMALYQSDENRIVERMELQMLKQRRVKPKNWLLSWAPWMGVVHGVSEVSFEGIDV